MKQAVGRWWAETAVYLAHVAALARPGARVRGFAVHPFQAGALHGWQASDLCLLVEEGRRQVDRQRADLDRIQARSQLLFTVAVFPTAAHLVSWAKFAPQARQSAGKAKSASTGQGTPG